MTITVEELTNSWAMLTSLGPIIKCPINDLMYCAVP